MPQFIAEEGQTLDEIVYLALKGENPGILYADIRSNLIEAYADNAKEIAKQGTHFKAGTLIEVRTGLVKNRKRVSVWE